MQTPLRSVHSYTTVVAMPAVKKVSVYKIKKVTDGHELRWRLYLSGAPAIERQRTWMGTGSRVAAVQHGKHLERAASGVVEHGERWAFDRNYEPIQVSNEAVEERQDTVWNLACDWRSATWGQQS